jgi:hypothetical protein
VAVGKGLFFSLFFYLQNLCRLPGVAVDNFFCFALQLALPTATWAVDKAFTDNHHQGQSAKLRFLQLGSQLCRQSWEMCFFAVFAALPHVSHQPKHIYVYITEIHIYITQIHI